MYKFFIFLIRFFPYLPATRASLFRTLSGELFSGKTIVESFRHMSETVFSRRLKVASRLIYEKLEQGQDVSMVLLFFPALFPRDFVSLISRTNRANIPFQVFVDIYLDVRMIRNRVVRGLLAGNFAMIIMAVASFLLVDYGTRAQVLPMYDFFMEFKNYSIPAGVLFFVMSYKFFLYVLLPYLVAILLLSVFFVFLNNRYTKVFYDLFVYLIPPFSTIHCLIARIIFFSMLARYLQSGVLLQEAIIYASETVDNYFFKRQLSVAIVKMTEGLSFTDSFSKVRLLSSIDKEAIFLSSINRMKAVADVIDRYKASSVIIISTLTTFVRIVCIAFILFWFTSFGLAWFDFALKYIFRLFQ